MDKRGRDSRREIAEQLHDPSWKQIENEEKEIEREKELTVKREQYFNMIEKYKDLSTEISRTFRKHRGLPSSELTGLVHAIDVERHDLHLEIQGLGEELGKSIEDVLVDIVRMDNSLSTYGLPELSILVADDIVATGEWHNPFQINVERGSKEASIYDPDFKKHVLDGADPGVTQDLIGDSEVMIVYDITPSKEYETFEFPTNIEELRESAKRLATEVDGKYLDVADSGYHESYVNLVGVVIPREKFEKTLNTIKNQPKKFRSIS